MDMDYGDEVGDDYAEEEEEEEDGMQTAAGAPVNFAPVSALGAMVSIFIIVKSPRKS